MHTIRISDTHIYKGCIATLPFKLPPNDDTFVALIEFSDQVIVSTEIEQKMPGELILHVESYITSSGTSIPAKSWRIRSTNEQGIWKVTGKN